ncbi:glutathione S-transferase [Xanthomonas translucens pv. arrhenatheri]|jgi:glutathione S-transferase|uniref:Glutathione S-transferase, N-terminal domain protein n=2 Tax=Xanthomonas graminis TaxID=3390026 RepID=A0A0K2ZG17_9XANT|nr:glutathione S-transferase family protein [Xanthomonas translucens]EKU25980.1 glutathione transferase [Xanthomonas translucens pv. graminis ART-Xtg29]OAX58407.1 glutathione S-transferase [Xanthomonas translucens pv. graminis]OAX64630.1 glutathione S-transferase [Xanthomonas translucens pv. arrhenatheri]UKE53463.1 glutathione S-transferase family protein [Xanthomonas translucens pv. graminis]UKE76474.1 glutathione S-transferase family protein [Xanthomonas translucens pv. arrhenatheri]
MSTEIVLYTHPLSRGRVARWMLEETGLPYSAQILDYGTTMKAPAYLAINPMGKVPALRHGAAVVTENAAICAYLADLVPERQLAPPPGSPARADYYRWLFFMAGPVEGLLTAKEGGALAPARSAGYGREADLLQTLEQAVAGGDYLAGDRFSAADLYTAALLGFYMRIGMLEPRPAFVAFAQRHAARPAALRANAIDAALIAAHPKPDMPASVVPASG